MNLVPFQKSPFFHSLKVSSETQENLLIVTPYKIKKQIPYLQHKMVQKVHYPPKGRKEGIMKKYWTKLWMKPSRLDFKSCSLTTDVEELSLFYPSSFADCNTLPSQVVLLPMQLSLAGSAGSGILNISWYPVQPGIRFHRSMKWHLQVSMRKLPCHMPCLSSLLSLMAEEDSTTSLYFPWL